jgi:reductive dehalogenase
MHWLKLAYFLLGGAVGIYIALFLLSSMTEKRYRAVGVAAVLLILLGTGWTVWYVAFSNSLVGLSLSLVCAALGLGLFFGPIGKTRTLPDLGDGERVDERDVMFAREEYLPGSDKYNRYYRMHPEHKDVDDRLRELPVLLQKGGRYYDPERSPQVRKIFSQISLFTTEVDGEVASHRAEIDPVRTADEIKRRLAEQGAYQTGIAPLEQRFVYSHVGRGPEPWGRPIINHHRRVIVFAVEMDYESVETAPDLPITEEAAHKYLLAANISIELARYIRSLGYPARAHISDSNYQIMLPPVATAAGLGELGRIGYLISPRLGARLRLGAVTTDLPLALDQPRSFGLQDFCDKCLKCAVNCPSAAISGGDISTVRGVGKWPLEIEKCIRYWRLAGTDCGICMKVCPFSHPPTFVHNVVRAGIRRSAFARSLAVRADDLFYGRKARYPNL